VKVLIVIDSLEVGTAARVVSTLAKAAPSEQLELEVVSLQFASGGSSTIVRRLEELGIESSFISIRRLSDLRSVNRVANAIRASAVTSSTRISVIRRLSSP
jgi:hypothetical protein